MKKKMNNKGFTLVELLAVVVVLAIVAAIAMQSITTIIKNNRIDSFLSSMNTVSESAVLACTQDGDLTKINDYIKAKGVVVTVSDNTISVSPNKNGEFKSLKAADINGRKNNFKGEGSFVECTSSSATETSTGVTCGITYVCE